MVVPAQFFHADTVLLVEAPSLVSPVLEPLVVLTRLYKELHFHLLKFAGTEDKVLGNNFVTESLSYLSDSEGNLHAVRLNNILVVNINTLGCFWTQVYNACGVFSRPDVGFKHEVEGTRLSKLSATAGTFFGSQGILIHGVGTIAHLTLLAVYQGIGEVCYVARSLPNTGMHQNGSIKTHNVVVKLGHFLPPSILYILLQLNTDWAVIPSSCLSAVNLR